MSRTLQLSMTYLLNMRVSPIFFQDNTREGSYTEHTQKIATTPGTSCPTLFEKCVGSLTSHIELINMEGICETGPTVYSPYPRRLEGPTICRCNYKDSTFSSVILRTWVLVRPKSNSRPPAWQPDPQPTEPPVRGLRDVSFWTQATLKRLYLIGWFNPFIVFNQSEAICDLHSCYIMKTNERRLSPFCFKCY